MRTRDELVEGLRERILAGLHLGTLSAGERLASTREVASATGAAPRTVLAAYRALEAEGIVEMRARSGIYVAGGARSARAMLPQLASWVVDLLVQSVARGIAPREFPERVRRCLETLRLRAACVECNADQMRSICTELHNDYGFESQPVDLDRLRAGDADAVSVVRDADLLVTTSSHGSEMQQTAARVERPLVIISLRSELVNEMLRLLEAGPVYFVTVDPRFSDALHDVLRPMGRDGNARLVVLGRDDLAAIPAGAPTYVTAAAREHPESSAHAGGVIPLPRVFSLQAARELLTFIVLRNIAALQTMGG